MPLRAFEKEVLKQQKEELAKAIRGRRSVGVTLHRNDVSSKSHYVRIVLMCALGFQLPALVGSGIGRAARHTRAEQG